MTPRPSDAPTDDARDRFATFFAAGALPDLQLPHVSARRDLELLGAIGPQVFGVTRNTGSGPGSPNALLECLSGLKATTRNWNTTERIIRACT